MISTTPSRDEDRALETQMGLLLRGGVSLAAAVIALGGAVFLAHHAHDRVEFSRFTGVAPQLRSLRGILTGVMHADGASIIQLGLLLLIATPVARVVFAAFGFLRERDLLYVAVSLIVLAVLLYSLIVR